MGEARNNASSSSAPAVKRAKVDPQSLESIRFRNILVRYKDCKHPVDHKGKSVTRTREDAESILRGILEELRKDGDHSGDGVWAAKSTPTIIKLCQKHSECASAVKPGASCGDLGWINKKELKSMGGAAFEDALLNLRVAEWSDILCSDHGVQLMM